MLSRAVTAELTRNTPPRTLLQVTSRRPRFATKLIKEPTWNPRTLRLFTAKDVGGTAHVRSNLTPAAVYGETQAAVPRQRTPLTLSAFCFFCCCCFPRRGLDSRAPSRCPAQAAESNKSSRLVFLNGRFSAPPRSFICFRFAERGVNGSR